VGRLPMGVKRASHSCNPGPQQSARCRAGATAGLSSSA
jgi:hypothetical protein